MGLLLVEEKEGFEGLISKCAGALKRPVWPIYLGRKACVPTRPVFEKLTDEYEGLEDALKRYPWSWKGACMKNREFKRPVRAYVEDDRGNIVRQDAVRINPTRQYGFRHVRMISRKELEDVPIEA